MRRYALSLLVVGCLASPARADDFESSSVAATGYPGRFVDRPLTLRQGMMRIDARYQYRNLGVGEGGGPVQHQLGLGAAIGITDGIEFGISHHRDASYDLEDAGALVVDVGRNRGSYADRSGDLSLYGRFAFANEADFAIAGDVSVQIPLHDYSDWRFVFGLPVRARLAPRFNLDLAPEVAIAFEPDDDGEGRQARFDLNIPVAGVLQLGDQLWIAGRSGIFWNGFDVERFYIPLLLEVGFTAKNGPAPVLDVALQGGMPRMLTPGLDDAFQQQYWMLRLNLNAYLQL